MPRITVPAVAAALITLFACGKSDDEQRNLELVPTPAPSSQPTLSDVPAATSTSSERPPAKSTTSPRATPTPVVPPPAAVVPAVTARPASFGTIAAGTELAVRSTAKACTDTKKVGDRIVTTVADAVAGSDGATIPAGATATLEVTEAVVGHNDENKVRLAFKLVLLEWGGNTYEVAGADVIAPPVTKVRRQSTGDQATKVATGAAIGAVVGQVIGKNTKSTVVGTAVGAVGGAAIAHKTADYDGCVAAEARLTVRLTQGLRVRV